MSWSNQRCRSDEVNDLVSSVAVVVCEHFGQDLPFDLATLISRSAQPRQLTIQARH